MTDKTWPPPWTLKPAYADPEVVREYDENQEPLPEFVHWSLAFGFALNVGHLDGEDATTPLTISAHFSDADLARGFMKREVTPEQVENFAHFLLTLAAEQKLRAAEAVNA